MTRAKNITSISIVLILIGFVCGIIFTGSFDLMKFSGAEEKASNAIENSTNGIPSSKTFVEVAEEAKAWIVSITSEKSVKIKQFDFGLPFDDEGFWEKFFNVPEEELKEKGLGSGVIITADGYILTNYHVISQAEVITVRFNDKKYDAEVKGSDKKTDLAVIKIEAEEPFPTAKLGNSDEIKVGEWVLAVGAPFGLEHSVTAGIISAVGRANINLADYEDFIQTDAAINPGNSGGALVNLRGEVIGINTAIASRTGGYQGVGFAIPVNMAKLVTESLIEEGHVVRGWLGIMIQNIDEDMAKGLNLESTKGVLVGQVLEDTPAEKAGLKVGDVIIEMNGAEMENTYTLRNKIAATKPGTEVELTIVRKGKEKTVTIELGTLPEDEEVIKEEKTESAKKLGIVAEKLTETLAEKMGYQDEEGVVIFSVDAGSPAAEAGLKKGDLIKEVNQNTITTVKEYEAAIEEARPGEVVLLLVRREDKTFFVALRVPEKE
ncbi:DegQ family serine endoprotease [bacterium]|nr:DegQ family serine endoprotease [bacterium]